MCAAPCRPLPSQPGVLLAAGAPLLSVCGRRLRTQIPSANPSAPNSSGPSCPTPETLARPQLTPEKGSISSGVALGQWHLVLSLAQDGGEDTAEGPGAILSGGVRGSEGLGQRLGLGRGHPLCRPRSSPGTLFSKLYLLRSRDSVARRSPWVRAPCPGWGRPS